MEARQALWCTGDGGAGDGGAGDGGGWSYYEARVVVEVDGGGGWSRR